MKKKKSNLVSSQIKYLYKISYLLAPKKVTYIPKLKVLAKKYQLRLALELKRSVCKECECIIIPNVNSESLVTKLKEGTALVTRCLHCNHQTKIVYQKERNKPIN